MEITFLDLKILLICILAYCILAYLISFGILISSFWLWDNHRKYKGCKFIEKDPNYKNVVCHYFGKKEYESINPYSAPIVTLDIQEKFEKSK